MTDWHEIIDDYLLRALLNNPEFLKQPAKDLAQDFLDDQSREWREKELIPHIERWLTWHLGPKIPRPKYPGPRPKRVKNKLVSPRIKL
jgi:hypothetical protein